MRVIRKDQIEALAGEPKTHFLNEGAKRINKSLGDLVGLRGMGFHVIEVPAGCESTEFHVHHYEDECVYILEGEAEVTIGTQSYRLSQGDFVGYPCGSLPHTMKNVGSGPLRCIVVGQRLPYEVIDYPRKGKRLYIHEGRRDLVDWDQIQKA